MTALTIRSTTRRACARALLSLALTVGIAATPVADAQPLALELEQQATQQYRQLIEQARAQNALATERNPDLQRLRRIQGRILPFTYAINPRAREWHWETNLLRNDQINAFCMPGGKIVFFSGIITKLDLTDDEIAIVMGHEMTHALKEHGAEQAKKQMVGSAAAWIAGMLASAWLGINPNVTDMGARAANGVVQLGFSRADESEADRVGLELAARAGFDPRAGIALWEKMSVLAKNSQPAWLSNHPSNGDRVLAIRRLMPTMLPLYANAIGVPVVRLPSYRTTQPALR